MRRSIVALFGSAVILQAYYSAASTQADARSASPILRLHRRATASPSPSPTIQPTQSPTASPEPTASPSPSPSPSPSAGVVTPRPKRTSDDRAFSLTGGTWNCETIAGAVGTHVYELIDENTISMRNELRLEGRTFVITETYRFDPATEVWTVATERDAFRGTSPAWTSEKWIFEGTEVSGQTRRPLRMLYTDLGDVAFRRDFQSNENGHWKTFSAETCKRLQQ